jgi:ribosome-associated protein
MAPKGSRKISPLEKALVITQVALQKKPLEPLLLDVREHCSFADFFLILSGSSTRQTQALASHIEEVSGKMGYRPRGIEGRETGHWILLDYDEVIVHIFFESARAFYDLEGLWSEVPRMPLPTDNLQARAS